VVTATVKGNRRAAQRELDKLDSRVDYPHRKVTSVRPSAPGKVQFNALLHDLITFSEVRVT
jgi:hypothetical protein